MQWTGKRVELSRTKKKMVNVRVASAEEEEWQAQVALVPAICARKNRFIHPHGHLRLQDQREEVLQQVLGN